MTLLLVGVNHRTAPVDVRERLSVAGGAQMEETLAGIRALAGIDGAALLSTCNRVEAIVSATREDVIEPINRVAARFTRAKDAGIVDDGLEWPNRVGLLGEGAGFLDAGQVAGERRLSARNGMHGMARSIAIASMQHHIVS